MKLSKLAAGLFAAAGTVLLIGSLILCLSSLNRPARVDIQPEGAQVCADAMLTALNNGDFSAAAKLFYGNPDLGLDAEPASPFGKQLWKAYRDSISASPKGSCYAADTDLLLDATVTALDIPGTLKTLDARASDLLKQQAEETAPTEETPPQIQKGAIVVQALTDALAEDAKTTTQNITLRLVHQDGQWWVMPDTALLQILSGGLR